MDPFNLAIASLVGFWVLSMIFRLGGALIHLLLLIAVAAVIAKYLNFF